MRSVERVAFRASSDFSFHGYANHARATRGGPPPPADSLLFPDDRHVHGNARQPDRLDGAADHRRGIWAPGTLRLDRLGLSARPFRLHAGLRQAWRPFRPQIRDDGRNRDLHRRLGSLRPCRIDEHADRRPRAAGPRRRRHPGVDLRRQCRSVRAARTRPLSELFQPGADGLRRHRPRSRRHDERSLRLALDLPRQRTDRLRRSGRPRIHAALPQAGP